MPLKNSAFAGYIALANNSNNYFVSGAFGTFVQPTVTCNPSARAGNQFGSQGVNFGVALINMSGPFGNAGTTAVCLKGASTPIYFADLGFGSPEMTVRPGDVFVASVRYSAGYVTQSLSDLSTGEYSLSRVFVGNPGSIGAGFIITLTGAPLLARFAPLTFSSSYVTINGVTKGVGAFPAIAAAVLQGILTNAKGTHVLAVPSKLSASNTDFRVTWKHS